MNVERWCAKMSPREYKSKLPAIIILGGFLLTCSSNAPTSADGNNYEIPPEMPQTDISWSTLASSPWPMYRHDPQHTGRSAYQGPQEAKVDWLFETGGEVYSSPAIGPDGTVYFGSNDSCFYAVNSDGSLKWKFKTDVGIIQSSPLIAADGIIYFSAWNASTNYVYAIRADGVLRWRSEGPESSITPTISVDGEEIYCAGRTIFSLSAKTGEKKWELGVPGAFTPAITPTGETIYWGSTDGNLYATDNKGRMKWKFHLGEIPSTGCVDNDGNVYLNAGSYCYSLAPDGTVRWKYEKGGVSIISSPAIGADGTIYTLGRGGSILYALNYAGGLKWEFELRWVGGSRFEKVSESTPIVDSDGTIYLGTLTDRTETDTLNFLAINSDGSHKYAISLRSPDGSMPDIDSTPAISASGNIYVGSDRPAGRHLYKIK